MAALPLAWHRWAGLAGWLQRLVLGSLLGLLLHGTNAAAAPVCRVMEQGVLTDPEGSLTVTQVPSQSFTPFEGMLVKGYTKAAHWIRVQLYCPRGVQALVLRLQPSYLDDLQLYEPLPSFAPAGALSWKLHQLGDRFITPDEGNEALSANVAVAVPGPDTSPVYYLRMHSTSSSLLQVQALSPEQAAQADTHQAIFLGFLLSCTACLLLVWMVNSQYSGIRDLAITAYVLYLLSSALMGAWLMGYSARWWPALGSWHDSITSALVLVCTLAGQVFHMLLLLPYRPPLVGRVLMALGVMVGASTLPLLGLGHALSAMSLNSLVMLVSCPVWMTVAWFTRIPDRRLRRWLWGYYGLQGSGLALNASALLGWHTTLPWGPYSTLLHSLLAASIMFVLLQIRFRIQNEQQQAARLALERSEQQAAFEHSRLEEKIQFLAMLTHELKSPLSVMQMGLGPRSRDPVDDTDRKAMRVAMDDMTTLIERCLQAEQLDNQGFAQTVVTRFALRPLVEGLAGKVGRITGTRFEVAVDHGIHVHTDENILGIIVSNLLDNASKYGDPGTPPRIQAALQTDPNGDELRVTVRNRPGAAGFPDPQRVFEKYYRAPAAQAQRGSGLGLWLLHSLAGQLGGDIDYRSDAHWIEFEVWIPSIPRPS